MIFAFADFTFDTQRLDLRRAGQGVAADEVVLRVLALLLRKPGHLVSKDDLVREIGQGGAVADNVISVTMARVRKLLGDARGEGELVKAVYGRGYRFVLPALEVSAQSTSSALAAPPFVGRERVLADLRRAHRDAQLGRGRMCALLGEPGIGKTYAVEAFIRGLPSATRTIWGFCQESGDAPPLSPWRQIVREVVADSPDEQRALHDPALRALLRDPVAPEGGEAGVDQAFVPGDPLPLAYEAVLQLLATAAQRAPLLLVIEDLQRADAATLALLLHLLDQIALQRILVIATLRHNQTPAGEVARARLASALGHRNCERILLERLPEAEVRAYVLALLGEGEQALASTVFVKSDGNPFFMAELCRQLRAREPRARDGVWLPDAALELVRQHVARLDLDSLGVLSAAAVIGRSFELALLRAVTDCEPSVLMASLDSARAAEVLIAAPDAPTAFAFGHALFRAVLYDALAPRERRHWHLRVAEALDQRARAGASIVASELAYHLHAALPAADPEKTIHYCRLAAEAAAASFAHDEVVRQMRHALAALDLMQSPSIALRMQFVHVIASYARAGSAREYESAARELARLARVTGDAVMLVRAGMMFNLHPGFKQLSGGGDAFAHALTLLPSGETALRAAALAGIAASSPTCFSAERVSSLLAEAVPLARASETPATQYDVLTSALTLHGGPSHTNEASALLVALDGAAQENPTGLPLLPIHLSRYRAVIALQRGELPTAQHCAEATAAHARRLQHGELRWQAERFLTLAALERGPSGALRSLLAQLHQRADDPGLFGLEAFRAFDRATWLAELDETLQLDDADLRALAYDICDPPSLWSLKIRALASAGAHDEARTALRALPACDLAALPCDRDLLGTLGHIAYAAVLIGAHDHAQKAAERLALHREAYAAHVGIFCEGSVPHLLGLVALALGDAERAVRELEEGLARDEQAGLVRCAGYARLQLGHALRRRQHKGDGERARRLLAELASHAKRLGLERLAGAARAPRHRRR